MEEQSKEIVPSKKAKEAKPLTAKNKAFLQHLAAGRQTLEAYKLAGYNGEPHAAYQLRSELKQHLTVLLEQGGFSREQLAVEVNRLNELPLDPSIKNVNFKQKLDILRLMEKALPKPVSGPKVEITPFILINKASKADVKAEDAIEAEIVEPTPESAGPAGD